ncbi:hypothetical protein COB72_00420 [bacterium]|nr:MAG: hypothetical protein COB72_00420 [bacterium]
MNSQVEKNKHHQTCSIHVVENTEQSLSGWTCCRIGEQIIINPSRLATYCLAKWDARVYDAFVVAAAVQYCDHIKARPSRGWGRHFELRIPVHDPDLWNSAAVSSSILDALCFLTGDQWDLSFVARKTEAPKPENYIIQTESTVIIPYSDGLDSHITAKLIEEELGAWPLLVRLASKQSKGVPAVSRTEPFATVPYQVKCKSRESSGRSRGFKFALLSGVAAFLTGAQRIVLPESGQGSLAPAMLPAGQAYEDYRNHPLFTVRMEKFLKALFGVEVRYEYPHIWQTKGQTIAKYRDMFPELDSWKYTRSCWQPSHQVSVNGEVRQCGICAACILRRMSIHSAKLVESSTTYVWNNLSAPSFEEAADPDYTIKNPHGVMRDYAIAAALHHDHFAEILQTESSLVSVQRHIHDLSQSLEIDVSEAKAKLHQLVEQHRAEWHGYLDSLGPKSFIAQLTSRAK